MIKVRWMYIKNLIQLVKLYVKGTDSVGVSFTVRQLVALEEAIAGSIKSIITGIPSVARDRKKCPLDGGSLCVNEICKEGSCPLI